MSANDMNTLIETPEAQDQTIEGRLLMADFKESGRLLRVHPTAGTPLVGRFPEEMDAEVEGCIRRLVRVRGTMEYEPSGEPRWLNITKIEQINESVADANVETGAAWTYDFWENLSAAEYARRQGVRPITRFAELFGAGQTEDWEGFDEALEAWRAADRVK